MSPLWPEPALAHAAWANAVERGLVNRESIADIGARDSAIQRRDTPRRPIRRPLSSIAL